MVELYFAIRAKSGCPPLEYNEWCAFIRQRPELLLPVPRVGPKPGSNELITYRPRPDAASIVIDGEEIGSVGWSLDGSDQAIVDGESGRIESIALEYAAALNCDCEKLN